jgi:hypothetical protein
MKRTQGLLVIGLCALLLPSCATTATLGEPIDLSPYAPDAFLSANMLIEKQSRLSLPVGWEFQMRGKDAVKEIFFTFNDKMGNVQGLLRYFTLADGIVDNDKAARVVANVFFDTVGDKSLHRTIVNGNPAYIMTGTHLKMGWDFVVATIPEKSALNIIQIASDPGYLKAHPEIAYHIINSYKWEPQKLKERKIQNFLSFRCEDGVWEWAGDSQLKADVGYHVATVINDKALVVGIFQTKATSLSEMGRNLTTPVFDATFTLADGTALQTKASAFEKNEVTVVFYHFKFGDKYYYFLVSGDLASLHTTREAVHEMSQIKDLFAKYVYRNGI